MSCFSQNCLPFSEYSDIIVESVDAVDQYSHYIFQAAKFTGCSTKINEVCNFLFIQSCIKYQACRIRTFHAREWEFGVPVMENFIPPSMVWDAIATKHDK